MNTIVSMCIVNQQTEHTSNLALDHFNVFKYCSVGYYEEKDLIDQKQTKALLCNAIDVL